MKKILNVAAGLLLAALTLTGCASTGAGKAPTSIHPREYTFDLIDAGETITFPFNQYGPNYQAKCDFTQFVKKDKPQPGDTVNIKMKAVADMDMPVIFGVIVDPSEAAGYWKQLAEYSTIAENVVAGEPFEIDLSFELTAAQVSEFQFVLQYDNNDQEQPKINKQATLTLERLCESTDTRNEVPATPHVNNVVIDLNKYCAFCEMATEHPWTNGVQDFSVIENYKCRPEITKAFNEDLPIAGDTVHIVWKAVADADIAKLKFYLVDTCEKCAWWMEMSSIEDAPYIENIKAGETFTVDLDIPVTVSAVQKVTCIIQYEPGDAEPDGPCIIKRVKDE